jgi:hypothetical protein
VTRALCGQLQTSHLTPHTSHLAPHTSHLTLHTSHLTPHTSHLTPHTSHLTPHLFHVPLHEPVAQLVILMLHRRIKFSTAHSSRDAQRRISTAKHLCAGIRSCAALAVGHGRGSSRGAGCGFQVSFGARRRVDNGCARFARRGYYTALEFCDRNGSCSIILRINEWQRSDTGRTVPARALLVRHWHYTRDRSCGVMFNMYLIVVLGFVLPKALLSQCENSAHGPTCATSRVCMFARRLTGHILSWKKLPRIPASA